MVWQTEWLPDWLFQKQKAEREAAGFGGKGSGGFKGKGEDKGKSKGKGWGKDWGKSSWGKGKGKGKKGLGKDIQKRVWVGNLPEGLDWKALQDHMNQAGKTTWVELFHGNGAGTGAVNFATQEEAAHAIKSLNGTIVAGASIEVDVWEKRTD